MAIYDNLPYTNFHELNADWLLKQMKEAKAKIDEYQEVLDQFEEDYNVLLGLASAMTVAGSNVTVAGSLTANGLIGNLTGNVTGDVTGNVTGDVTGDLTGDVTGGSFQGSYVEATNGQITHNLTVGNDAEIFNNLTVDGTIFGNLTGDVSGNAATATLARLANALSFNTIAESDMNLLTDSTKPFSIIYSANTYENVPDVGQQSEPAIVFAITLPNSDIIQIAIWYQYTLDIYVRAKESGTWGVWDRIAYDV